MAMPQHTSSRWATGNGAPGELAYDKQFFSGQDCFIFLFPHYAQKLIPIPATNFEYGISQQKQPIYGAWSYHWDAVARGQVIVQGQFTIVYSKPNLIGQLLGKPGQSDNPPRSSDGSVAPLIDNTKSLEAATHQDLRNEIWGANASRETGSYINNPSSLNGHQSAFPFGHQAGRPEGAPEADYCAHQPFDIIIAQGSNPSMNFTDNSKFTYSTWIESTKDYMRMQSGTHNEQVEGWSASQRVRIEHVELMSAGTVMEVSGQPLQETYTFIARNVTTPQAR